MANIVRKHEGESVGPGWEPFDLMRRMFDWDPFQEMVAKPGALSTFVPHFEVKETKDGFLFKADLPGIEEKDLDISITANRLTVSGKREQEERQEGERYFALERSYGSFSRSFTLPEGVDAEHVDAELRDGVLTLHLPKTAELKPKKIALKGGEKARSVLEQKPRA